MHAVLKSRCSFGPILIAHQHRARRPVASASLSLRTVETLPQGRLPTVLRSRRRWPASGCIRSLAHGRDHFAASRAAGSRGGLPNAPSGSPSEALRSPSRWAGKICIAAYKPSFLRFARRNDLALRAGAGEGEPLATARSRRAMDRSLRLAPINRSRRQAASFACNAAAFTRIVDSAMNVGFAYGPVRDSGMDASPRQRRSVHSGRRY